MVQPTPQKSQVVICSSTNALRICVALIHHLSALALLPMLVDYFVIAQRPQ
jgi:hypothetical protein